MIDSILKVIQGWVKVKGDTDGTKIGNVADSLHSHITNATQDIPLYISPSRASRDTFERMRVSEPVTLFDFEHKYEFDDQIYFDNQVVGGATVVHNPDTVSSELHVTTASGDKAILQTRRYIEYIKGKSQLVYISANFNGAQANVRKRLGCFDDENGVLFEVDGLSLAICERSKTSGAIVEVPTLQADWNLDTLDGSGDANNPSGALALPDRQQLFVIDWGWLGANVVRYGIVIDGGIVYIHQSDHSNVLDVPYSQSGQLPIRVEIENLAAPALADMISVTCGTVISEGGQFEIGRVRGIFDTVTPSAYSNTESIIKAIRINPLYKYSSAKLIFKDFLSASGTKDVYFSILFNPVIVGAVWQDVPNSIMQELVSYTSFTNGDQVDAGHFSLSTKDARPVPVPFENNIFLGRAIDGTPDVFALTGDTIGGSGTAFTGLSWREYV